MTLGDSVLAVADAWGQYVFKIRTGTYSITGSCEGYESVTQTVTVEPNGRHYVNFFLPRKNRTSRRIFSIRRRIETAQTRVEVHP